MTAETGEVSSVDGKKKNGETERTDREDEMMAQMIRPRP
jgi:hypothetical protein